MISEVITPAYTRLYIKRNALTAERKSFCFDQTQSTQTNNNKVHEIPTNQFGESEGFPLKCACVLHVCNERESIPTFLRFISAAPCNSSTYSKSQLLLGVVFFWFFFLNVLQLSVYRSSSASLQSTFRNLKKYNGSSISRLIRSSLFVPRVLSRLYWTQKVRKTNANVILKSS